MEVCSKPEKERALTRKCPLCGAVTGHLIENLHFSVFDDSPVSGDFALVACAECGLAFYDTSSTQADFDHYYQQNLYYCSAITVGTGGSGANDIKRFQKVSERIASLLPEKSAAIFDVGCAKGGLLSVLEQQGFTHLYGVDMQPECVGYVRNMLGMSVETGSALELPFPGVHADALIYSHVAEHVIDLSALVNAARKKLNDSGIIYVEVPDASRYGEYTKNPYQDLYLEHVNHFDLRTLTLLFEIGGFDTVTSGQFELEAQPAEKVPCIWAIFRKVKRSNALKKPDRALELHLSKYVSWSGQHPALKRFADLAKMKTPLYLWGISQFAMLMIGQTPLGNCSLRRFVDMDPSKRMRTLLGHPIESPEVLLLADQECTVLVTALGYEYSIASTLVELGFKGTVLNAAGTALVPV